jgi:hypothetical protein
VLQIGIAPDRIDLLLRVEGLAFDAAWPTTPATFLRSAPSGVDKLARYSALR